MAKKLTAEKKAKVKQVIYQKADECDYLSRGRIDNGRFMDELVNDPEVGGILKEYMDKERIRTYVKDSVLNAYAKNKKNAILAAISPEATVKKLFNKDAFVIQECKGKDSGLCVCRSTDGLIFVISTGTVLKWETALRKALELIAREPTLILDTIQPSICLKLAVASEDFTDGEKVHIETALAAISVKALFCK